MEETKFKVGDRVKLREKDTYLEAGALGIIRGLQDPGDRLQVQWDGLTEGHSCSGLTPSGSGWNVNAKDVVLVKKGISILVRPNKFALQYELDEDPTEYFATLPQVKARIKELASRSDLKRDKMFLHTLSKTQKVELGTSITLRKS